MHSFDIFSYLYEVFLLESCMRCYLVDGRLSLFECREHSIASYESSPDMTDMELTDKTVVDLSSLVDYFFAFFHLLRYKIISSAIDSVSPILLSVLKKCSFCSGSISVSSSMITYRSTTSPLFSMFFSIHS